MSPKTGIRMNEECEYECEFHGRNVQWHHPISSDNSVGLWLCEAHHSLLNGRKKRYIGEMISDKGLDEMRIELKALELGAVLEAGYTFEDIDKK